MKFKAITFDTSDQTIKGFEAGRCDMLTSDQSQLYSLRIKLAKPDTAIVLPEVISKEPLGPVVRQGDDQWFNIVRWSLNAMINAEEMGLTSANIKKMKDSKDPAIGRMLGGQGEKLGLDDNWSANIISQVGNYAESFERNVGAGSPLKIGRGLNALWSKGGIMYAPPIR
jgi:general L-amino acid transport system substrate-binding protein